jgi:hypothetical protein
MRETAGKTPNRARNRLWAAGFAAILVAAGLLTGKRNGWFGPHGPGAELTAQPVYRVLEEHEPEAWGRVLAAYRRIGGDPARRAEFINLSNSEFSAAATRRLARASPDAQLALMRDMVANLKRLHARKDDACFRYLYPEIAGAPDVARDIPPEAQARTLTLAADVIRTAAESPSPPTPPDQAARKIGPIIDAVYAEFGADTQLLAHADDPGVDRRKICAIAVSLYERILALPPAEAAQVFSAVAKTD